MKTINILIASIFIFLTSCNNTKTEKEDTVATQVEGENTVQKNEGLKLMEQNCYACHNPKAESHDNIIAPPFKAVKMHYTREYDNKKDFVNAVVKWVQNPSEDKALMSGAVNRFKIMPKLPLATKNLEKIANYLYDHEVENPKWMDAHMKEMKADGMMGHKEKK